RSDTGGVCTFFSQAWPAVRGRTMEQEGGYGWADNVHPTALRRCLDTYTSSVKAQQGFSVEYRLRRSDGEYRWVLDSGVPRYTKEDEFIGFAGSRFDIVERKKIEAASQFLASIVQSS